MGDCFKADIEKFIAGALYIAKNLSERGLQSDFYRIFKIMFFADKKSLQNYYQTIFGDWHALPYGPAPEDFYALIKKIRNNEITFDRFYLEGNNIILSSDPDMDELAESDIECINASIQENGNLSYDELKLKSHGTAWENTPTGYAINILDIVTETGVNSHIRSYIKDKIENCSPSAISASMK
jgi:uncharacterized phage-associated protein